MQQNGSPEAIFDFDDERTWFQVTLPIHPAFRKKPPFTADLSKIEWNLHGIDNLLNQIIEYAEIDERGIAGDIADIIKIFDSLIVNEIFQDIGDIAGDIAGGILRGINEKTLKILEISKIPLGRKNILTGIGFVNNVKNFNTYLAPLIYQNWITMTIPDKPTSPRQQYFTTLKGRLVLELLKYSPL